MTITYRIGSPDLSSVLGAGTGERPTRLGVAITSVAFFFFQAEDGIRDLTAGVQTCALPISIPAQWLCQCPDYRPSRSHACPVIRGPWHSLPCRSDRDFVGPLRIVPSEGTWRKACRTRGDRKSVV